MKKDIPLFLPCCKHSNHDKHGKHSQVHVTRKFIKKGIIVRQGEVVIPKLMVSVKCNTEPFVW